MAPILFKDYNGKPDKWKIFRNPILFWTYSALVRGVKSIRDLDQGKYTKETSHSTVDKQWGIRAITPGAIAAATVYARFAASEDDQFQPTGSKTHIPYQSDYEYYLKYLYEGLQSKARSVLSIFEIWNREFYPNNENNNFTNATGSTVDSRLDDFINDLYEEGAQAAE